MTARSWGLSGNARIVREDVLELNSGHIHSYVDITATTFPCVLHMCIVKLNCPFPFRWRWNDFFDWTYCKEDPRLYEIMRESPTEKREKAQRALRAVDRLEAHVATLVTEMKP